MMAPKNVIPQLVQQLASPPAKECRLVQGIAALAAQCVLLCIVITVLVVKRHKERPRRPWNIWALDVSKQAFSGGAGHLCGMAIAIVAHHKSGASSPCGWYLVVYSLDATLGITVALSLHRAGNALARHHHFARQRQAYGSSSGGKSSEDHLGSGGGGADPNGGGLQCSDDEDCSGKRDAANRPWWRALVEIGNYGDPPSLYRWGIQVGMWVTCVVCARIAVATVVILGIPYFRRFTQVLEAKFRGHPDLLLFFVMVGVPMCLNIVQAWVQDQFLKWRHKGGPTRLRRSAADGDDDKAGGSSDALLLTLSKHQRKAGAA